MPARFSRIVEAAKPYGISFEKPASGSHWKAKKPGCRAYPIPAHNGLKSEISDAYIAGFCRAFGIDRAEFKGKL